MKRWALLVAAGAGRRMETSTPKQYLRLAGRYVIEYSLSLFAGREDIDGIVVVLAADDQHWAELNFSCDKPLIAVTGGVERSDSVLAGLEALAEKAEPDDWVLVHDAARACLTDELLDRLFEQSASEPAGGLLAIPARDTLKRADEGRIAETLDRSHIWQAQTPQMFRLAPLTEALINAKKSGRATTDEAMVMERAGHHPRLVPGSANNIKITTPEDLVMAEFILKQQGQT